jgi:hypothetical protein
VAIPSNEARTFRPPPPPRPGSKKKSPFVWVSKECNRAWLPLLSRSQTRRALGEGDERCHRLIRGSIDRAPTGVALLPREHKRLRKKTFTTAERAGDEIERPATTEPTLPDRPIKSRPNPIYRKPRAPFSSS